MAVAPNASTDLTTLADLKAWMTGIGLNAPPDDQLQQVLTAVSDRIQVWLGRRLLQASYTARFNGRDHVSLVLPNWPITAVASLTVDGCAIPPAPDDRAPGFLFDDMRVYLRGSLFRRGVQNVAVAYTAGYAPGEVPPEIVQAVRDGCKGLVQLFGRAPGMIEEKLGQVYYRYETAASMAAGGNLDTAILSGDVSSALRPFRRVTPAG